LTNHREEKDKRRESQSYEKCKIHKKRNHRWGDRWKRKEKSKKEKTSKDDVEIPCSDIKKKKEKVNTG
jgi:hypothetical protein